MRIARGKIVKKKTGRGKYESMWMYIPSKLAKDDSFPFMDKEVVTIEIMGERLVIRKRYSRKH
ncbi:MAG: hypothetical protein ACFFAH_16420 [Promethearchaeota archaeon]